MNIFGSFRRENRKNQPESSVNGKPSIIAQPQGNHPADGVELQFDDAHALRLPLHQENEDTASRSSQYWTLFNKAWKSYENLNYEDALTDLVALHALGPYHAAAVRMLLRAYRHVRDTWMEVGDWAVAFEVSVALLNDRNVESTAHDWRKHQKILAVMQNSPTAQISANTPMEAPPRFTDVRNRKAFEIDNDRWRVEVLDVQHHDTDYYAYGHRVLTRHGTLEFSIGSVRFTPRDEAGHVAYDLEKCAYRIGAHPFHGLFSVLTQDLDFQIYETRGLKRGERSLLGSADDKHHVRCVSVSESGQLSIFTNGHQVFILDDDMKIAAVFKTPPAPGFQKRVEHVHVGNSILGGEQRRAHRVLGTIPGDKREEIRDAYREIAKRDHPDRNPGDPSAVSRMQEVNWAYELLAGASAATAWDTDREVQAYYRDIDEMKAEIDGLGTVRLSMGETGRGKDWIYAGNVDEAGKRIYLGCYSGRIFILNPKGVIEGLIDAKRPVVNIVPLGETVLIQTFSAVFSVSRQELVGEVVLGRSDRVVYHPTGFLIETDRSLGIFDLAAHKTGEIKAPSKIRNYFQQGDGLLIVTERHAARIHGVFA